MFLQEFPLMCPTIDNDSGSYDVQGFINIKGIDAELHVYCPNYPSSGDATVTAPNNSALAASLLLRSQQITLAAAKNTNLVTFLKSIQKLLNEGNDVHPAAHPITAALPAWWGSLLKDLDQLGWDCVSDVSSDLRRVTFLYTDEEDREHLLHATVPSDYPHKQPTYEAKLPVPLNMTGSTVRQSHQCWVRLVQSLEVFWRVMGQLDAVAAVLDPPQPQLHNTHRRLLLKSGVSVHCVVDPLSPLCPPQCQLIGPARLTDPLLARLTDNYEDWDGERSLLSNLEHLLGEAVVRRSVAAAKSASDSADDSDLDSSEGTDLMCCVCYCLHRDSQLPDTVCEHCHQHLHPSCLYQWLSGQTTSRQSMQYIYGDCPYCMQPISCKVPA